MQIIYHYDPNTMIFDQTIMVEKMTDQLPVNTTTISPDDVVQPAKWDPAAQKWIGQSIDDWHAQYNNQAEQPQPSVEQQLAELIKSNAQQAALNAQLIKQLSTLQTSQATQTAQTAQAVQAAQTQTTQEAE